MIFQCIIGFNIFWLRKAECLDDSYRKFLSNTIGCIEYTSPLVGLFMAMEFNATFNNISVISWRSVLLVDTGISGENHRPASSHRQTLSNNIVSSTSLLGGVRTHNVNGDGH